MLKRVKSILYLATSALALTITAAASAQTQPNNANQSTAGAEAAKDSKPAGAELEEIIITAQRREENLQKAALPVAVVSPEQLERAGVSSAEMLTSLVPALGVANTGAAGLVFFLRGVGNFTLSSTVDSAVAFNYDNVYVGRPTGAAGVFYDLERIEVLKGPQGTLYGRNATGGAINVLPVHPKLDQFEGYLNGSYGNYDAVTLEGAVNVPVGKNTALRLSGNLNDHDGYLSDGTSDGQTRALRAQVLSELTPDLKVRLAGDYASLRGASPGSSYLYRYVLDPASASYTAIPSPLGPSVGLFDPAAQAFRGQTFVFPAARPLDAYAPRTFVNNDYYGVNAEITLEKDFGTLTIIPAWRSASQRDVSSVGFLVSIEEKDEQHSIEARFTGKRIGIFDYTLGAMYYHEKNDDVFGVGESTLNVYQAIQQTTEAGAGFARITAHLTDTLRLVGGVRYTQDKKHMDATQESITVSCSTFVYPAFVPCFGAPLLPLTLFLDDLPGSLVPPAAAQGGPPSIVPTSGGAVLIRPPALLVNKTITKGSITWRGAVEYDVGPRSLLYASIETGFRAGGLQPTVGYESFRPEKITAYTIGSKNRFFDNRVQLNLEGFLWKYRDQQLAGLGIDAGGNPNFFTRNIGATTNYGVDIDAEVAVTPTTRLTGQVQYLRAKYDNFIYTVPGGSSNPAPYTTCNVSPTATTYVVDCTGKPAYNAPRLTVNLGVEQTIPLGSYNLVASFDTQYRSSRWIGFEFQPGMLQGTTWQSNAQLAFGPVNGKWSLVGFVRNIEDDRFVTNAVAYAFAGLVAASTNPPRTYGVKLGVKF